MSSAWSPMRSMSVIIFSAAEICLRSPATGCCCSSSLRQMLSMSRSFWSISFSSTRTRSMAAGLSPSRMERAVTAMASSQRAPMEIISRLSVASCSSNLLRISAKPPGDVVFCAFVLGMGENPLCLAVLHELSQQEKRRVVGDAHRLLHVVRHHDDSIAAFEFHGKVTRDLV